MAETVYGGLPTSLGGTWGNTEATLAGNAEAINWGVLSNEEKLSALEWFQSRGIPYSQTPSELTSVLRWGAPGSGLFYTQRNAAGGESVPAAKLKEWGVSQAPNSPWTLPSYFVERPSESVGSPSSLGPMANYYLSQLFPGIAGYMATEEEGPPAGAYVPPWTGMWEGRKSPSVSAYTTSETTTDTNTGAPIVKEKPGVTVAATPVAPSAQMWGQLQASGALPALQGYVENVLQTPWSEFQSNVQSYWPTRSGARQPASYRTLPQK